MVEMSGVEKFMVEKFSVALELNCLGLKLGVEMCFNPVNHVL